MFGIPASIKMQQAMTMGAVHALEVLAKDYAHMVEGQVKLIPHHAHRRAEDHFKKAPVMPSGPDLMDHYGRRAHDVDIEHAI